MPIPIVGGLNKGSSQEQVAVHKGKIGREMAVRVRLAKKTLAI
jgi:hypothetical protein